MCIKQRSSGEFLTLPPSHVIDNSYLGAGIWCLGSQESRECGSAGGWYTCHSSVLAKYLQIVCMSVLYFLQNWKPVTQYGWWPLTVMQLFFQLWTSRLKNSVHGWTSGTRTSLEVVASIATKVSITDKWMREVRLNRSCSLCIFCWDMSQYVFGFALEAVWICWIR